MSRPELWLLIAGMALLTFLLRSSFLLAAGSLKLPPLLRRSLTYVPPAVLAAIVVPALAQPSGTALGPVDVRLAAGAVAAVVAWRTHSIVATFSVGMLVLWGATWLLR